MKPLPTRPKQREIVADGEAAEVAEKAPNCLKTVLESSCSPRLLRNLPFMLLCLSNLFATQGLYIPYSFIPILAKERLCIASVNTTLLEGSASGEEGEDPCAEAAVAAAFLISIVGICNTLCRILSGYVTDLPGVNSLVVTTLALGLGGIAPLAMPFCYSYASFVVVCVMFGSFLSAWCAVTSPAIVDICGIDLLTSGFGSLTFVRGFAALVGPPIAGYLVDVSGSKEFAFYLSAGLLFTSALICGAAWLAQRAAAPPRSTAAPAAE